MKNNSLQKKINNADPERLSAYIGMFDKFLLYTFAANALPREVINDLLKNWETNVKKTIDQESSLRTEFLESTLQGRLAKKQKQPDGEAMRLHFLETLNTAK